MKIGLGITGQRGNEKRLSVYAALVCVLTICNASLGEDGLLDANKYLVFSSDRVGSMVTINVGRTQGSRGSMLQDVGVA